MCKNYQKNRFSPPFQVPQGLRHLQGALRGVHPPASLPPPGGPHPVRRQELVPGDHLEPVRLPDARRLLRLRGEGDPDGGEVLVQLLQERGRQPAGEK